METKGNEGFLFTLECFIKLVIKEVIMVIDTIDFW